MGHIPLVGGDFDAVDFGQVGDLAKLGDAAAVDDVGLDDGGAAGVEEVAKVEAGEEAFAGGHGDGAPGGDFGEGLGVLALGGLLEEQRTVGGDGAGEFDGRAGGGSLPHFEGDVEGFAAAATDGFPSMGEGSWPTKWGSSQRRACSTMSTRAGREPSPSPMRPASVWTWRKRRSRRGASLTLWVVKRAILRRGRAARGEVSAAHRRGDWPTDKYWK